jgi:hypothetical protein
MKQELQHEEGGMCAEGEEVYMGYNSKMCIVQCIHVGEDGNK